MQWNPHSDLVGKHAILSPSSWRWINYDRDKLQQVYLNKKAIAKGTMLHELANRLITLGVRLPRNKKTLNSFVNDAIGYHMQSEQPLYFSPNCFGTADAILFDPKNKVLRIHDLKTGYIPGHIEQLEIYAGLFYLEYQIDPEEYTTILRIYQFDEITEVTLDHITLYDIMQSIVDKDAWIQSIDAEVID